MAEKSEDLGLKLEEKIKYLEKEFKKLDGIIRREMSDVQKLNDKILNDRISLTTMERVITELKSLL